MWKPPSLEFRRLAVLYRDADQMTGSSERMSDFEELATADGLAPEEFPIVGYDDISFDELEYGEITQSGVEFLINHPDLKEYFHKPSGNFYDIGSGCGLLCWDVAIRTKLHSIGIEIDPKRFKSSCSIHTRLSEIDNIQFKNMSFTEVDFSNATIVFACQTCFYHRTNDIIKMLPKGCLFIFVEDGTFEGIAERISDKYLKPGLSKYYDPSHLPISKPYKTISCPKTTYDYGVTKLHYMII